MMQDRAFKAVTSRSRGLSKRSRPHPSKASAAVFSLLIGAIWAAGLAILAPGCSSEPSAVTDGAIDLAHLDLSSDLPSREASDLQHDEVMPLSDGARDAIPRSDTGADGGVPYPVPPPVPINLNYTLGCVYMPKPSYPTTQWNTLFAFNRSNGIKKAKAQRVPVLGYYRGDSPLAMDWQIKYAVDRGITYFVFDEYWTESSPKPVFGTSIGAFFKAKYNSYMQFAPLVITNNTVKSTPASKRESFLHKVIPYYVKNYFAKQNCLIVEGKPYVGIGSAGEVFGTTDPKEVKSVLDAADAYVAKHTKYKGAYWASTFFGFTTKIDFSLVKAMGFAAAEPYYEVKYIFPQEGISSWPITVSNPGTNLNYDWPAGVDYSVQATHFKATNKAAYAEAKRQGVQFISACAPDFDNRPRFFSQRFLYFSKHNQTSWWKMVLAFKKNVDANLSVIPTCTNTGKSMVGLGPWNEHGEAVSLEPSYSPFNDATNMSPFFLATTVAKIFGGPKTYARPIPSASLSRGFSPRHLWTFDSKSQTGLDAWWTTVNSVMTLAADNTAVLTFDSADAHLSASTWINSSDFTTAKVKLKVLSGGPISRVSFDWFSSTYSDAAGDFRGPQEPGKVFYSSVRYNDKNYKMLGGFREYFWDLTKAKKWKGKVFAINIRITSDPAAKPVFPIKVKIEKIWLEK